MSWATHSNQFLILFLSPPPCSVIGGCCQAAKNIDVFAGLSPCCSPADPSTPSPPESLPSMFVRSWSQAPIVRGVKLQSFVRGIKLQSFVESGSNRSWSQAPIFGGSQIPIVRSLVESSSNRSFVGSSSNRSWSQTPIVRGVGLF